MAFNIHLLRGKDPQAQFDAITEKDSNTLYLLQSGKGYLGDAMLFNADSNIDFADLQQVRDKLTYTETDESGQHVYSTIIGGITSNDASAYDFQTLMLTQNDNGLAVRTNETIMQNEEETAALSAIWNTIVETGEYDAETYKTNPLVLNTLPTIQFMFEAISIMINKKLESYVTHSVDDGTTV